MSAPDVDKLAEFIRFVDGRHELGAAALAERIVEWPNAPWADSKAKWDQKSIPEDMIELDYAVIVRDPSADTPAMRARFEQMQLAAGVLPAVLLRGSDDDEYTTPALARDWAVYQRAWSDGMESLRRPMKMGPGAAAAYEYGFNNPDCSPADATVPIGPPGSPARNAFERGQMAAKLRTSGG